MLVMIRAIVSAGESLAFEKTLSGRIYARMIPVWRARGYVVRLHFFRLSTPEKAIERVAQRVREGGSQRAGRGDPPPDGEGLA